MSPIQNCHCAHVRFSRAWALFLLAGLLASSGLARAQGVNLGNLPPHPRFLLTPTRLAEVRAEVATGQRKASLFDEMERRAQNTMALPTSNNIDKIMTVLLVGLVNQDQTYIDKAKTLYMGNVLLNAWPSEEIHWHMCYDWLYPYLSPVERDAVRTLSLPYYELGGQRPVYYNLECNEASWKGLAGLTFYGEGSASQNALCQGLVDEWDGRMRGVREYRQPGGTATSRGGVIPTRQYYFPDGGYYKGNHYGNKDIETLTFYLAVFKDTGLGDYWSLATSYLSNWGEYILRTRRPDNLSSRMMTGVSYGTDMRGYLGLSLINHYLQEPYTSYLLDMPSWSVGSSGSDGWWVICATWRPNVPELDPVTTLPLHKFYGSPGETNIPGTSYSERVYVRSGWNLNGNNDDVFFTLHAGDYFGDYYNFYQLGFELYYRGALAIRSGYYLNVDNQKNYYSRAVGNNCVVILDNSRTGMGDKWGQDDLYADPEAPQHLYDVSDNSVYNTAEILAFEPGQAEGGGSFYYVKGKLNPQNAYYYTNSTRKVQTQQREAVVYGRYVIVRDKVTLTGGSNSVRWLLHTINEPTIEAGTESGVTVPGHIITYTRGRYSAVRTETVDGVTYNGKITVQACLPASATMRKVGGSGYECWVDNGSGVGQNYPLDPGLYTDRNEAGQWRVETIAPTGTNIDFVHALWVGKPTETMAAVTTIDGTNSVGCQITNVGVFVFGKTGNSQSGIDYTITGELLEPVPHVIEGLYPETDFAVQIGEAAPFVVRSSESGAITFRAAGPASVHVEPAGLAAAIQFNNRRRW